MNKGYCTDPRASCRSSVEPLFFVKFEIRKIQEREREFFFFFFCRKRNTLHKSGERYVSMYIGQQTLTLHLALPPSFFPPQIYKGKDPSFLISPEAAVSWANAKEM